MCVRLFVLPLPCLHARCNFPQPGPWSQDRPQLRIRTSGDAASMQSSLASTRTCTATCPLPGYSSEGKLGMSAFLSCLCRTCILAATFRNPSLGVSAARSCGCDYWESGIVRRRLDLLC